MVAMRALANKSGNEDGAVTDHGDSSDLHRKKADKSEKNAELSTFIGYVGQKRCRRNYGYTILYFRSNSIALFTIPTNRSSFLTASNQLQPDSAVSGVDTLVSQTP